MAKESSFAAVTESFDDTVLDLVTKVEDLDKEKVELVEENEVLGFRNEKEEMEELIKKVEEDKKALNLIVEKANDLESKVLESRHGVSLDLSNGHEENVDVKIKKEFGNEGILVELADIDKEKALIEAKFIELEGKIKDIEEVKKIELADKESEIISLKKKVMELEVVIDSTELELSKTKFGNKELENTLNISYMKISELESKLIILQKKIEEAEKLINGLKPVTVNGVVNKERSNKDKINLQLALSAGAIALIAGGIISLHYARKSN